MIFKIIFSAFLFLLLSVFCFSCSSSSQKKLPSKQFSITCADGKNVLVNAEIADTYETRQHGFMERKSIPDGTGMIFVFDRDQILSFWMKNTPTPLSIAYIDYTGKIRNIFDMTPFSLSSVVSTVSVRYALEVPQGWFERAGVKIGDVVSLSPLSN